MTKQNRSQESLPLSMLLNRSPVTPRPQPTFRFARWAFGRRNLSQQFPQFKPGTLIGSQKCHTRLLGIVPHEDRYKQGQDEHGPQKVKNDEENSVALRSIFLRLFIPAIGRHSAPHDIGPAFLRNNLKENEERVPKVVKVVIRISNPSRGKNIPVINRAIIFANTISKVYYGQVWIIALQHLTVK